MSDIQTTERKLTIKQRKWIKEYIRTGNATEAAFKVYDCKDRDSAAIIGFENVRKLNFNDLMEEAGLTDNVLNNKLAEGLDANKQLSTRPVFKKDAPTSQSARELPAANEGTDDFIEVPDFAVRHKYLETAFKLKGRLKKDGDINVDGNNIQINVVAGGYVPKSGRTNGTSEGRAI